MEERQRRDEPLFTVPQGAKAAFVHVALAYIQEIEVAEQAAFRLAGGTGCVEKRALGRLARAGRRRRIEALEHGSVDDQARFAVLQDVVQLGMVVIRVHGDDSGTERVEREEVQQETGAVGQLERHAMARAIAFAAVDAGDVGDALARLRVRELELLGIDLQEWLCAVRAGGLLERGEDRRHWTGW